MPSNLARTLSRNKRRPSGLHGVRHKANLGGSKEPRLQIHCPTSSHQCRTVDFELLSAQEESSRRRRSDDMVPIRGRPGESYRRSPRSSSPGSLPSEAISPATHESVCARIPKPDGRTRPLGIASLEDKIVQHAVRTVLQCIYEEDFLGFSYALED